MNKFVIHDFDFKENKTKYGLIIISENNDLNAEEFQSRVGGCVYYPENGNELYDMANLNVSLLKNLILILDNEKEKIHWRKYFSFYSALMQSAQRLVNKECAYIIVTADGVKLQASMAGNDE